MLVHVLERHSDWDHSQTEEHAQILTSWEARLKVVDEAKALGYSQAMTSVEGCLPFDSRRSPSAPMRSVVRGHTAGRT